LKTSEYSHMKGSGLKLLKKNRLTIFERSLNSVKLTRFSKALKIGFISFDLSCLETLLKIRTFSSTRITTRTRKMWEWMSWLLL